MRKILLQPVALFVIITIACISTACSLEIVKAKGDIETKQYEFSDFENVSISSSAYVTIRKGEAYKIEIKTNKNVFEYINVEKVGNSLKIWIQDGVTIHFDEQPEIDIVMPNLTGVKQSGSGKIEVIDTFTPEEFIISIAGSGDLMLPTLVCNTIEAKIAGSGSIDIENLETKNANFSIAGSGSVKVIGKAETQKISIAGSGDVKNDLLNSQNVKISIAGSGDCKVHANNSLDVSISGSGDVYYKGSPQMNIKTSGSGEVHNRN